MNKQNGLLVGIVALVGGIAARTQAHAAPLAYVSGAEGVVVIDASTNSLVDRYDVGPASALAISSDGRLYVGSATAEAPFRITVVDTRTGLEESLDAPGLPNALSISPDGQRLWVSHAKDCDDNGDCRGTSGITVYETASLTRLPAIESSTPLGGRVAFDPQGAIAYAATAYGIAAIDATSFTLVATASAICCVSRNVAAHPYGQTAYILGNEFGGFLGIMDLRDTMDRGRFTFIDGQNLPELDSQSDMAFNSDGTRLFLPGSICRLGDCTDTLFVMDTSSPAAPRLHRALRLESAASRIALISDQSAYSISANDTSVTAVDLESGDSTDRVEVGFKANRIVVGEGYSISPPVAGDGDGCQLGSTHRSNPLSLVLGLLLLAAFRGNKATSPRRDQGHRL